MLCQLKMFGYVTVGFSYGQLWLELPTLMGRPFPRYEDSDEEEGQGDKENNANADNAKSGETVEEAMEKMFNDDEEKEKEKEETKENDGGDSGNVFPIFRRSSARTGLRGSPAKLASTPNKGWVYQST